MNALPAAIESPSDHVGWIAAQIVAVPTSNELGIATDQELTSSSSEFIYSKFRQTNQDVYVYVRYLQTGQIERKSLVEQIRPVAAISIGAELSIRHELDSGAHAWGRDLQITKFQAYCGGRYIITTAVGSATMVFSTMPLGSSSGTILTDDHVPNPAVPELFWTLLGPSRVFRRAPQVGEKVQIEFGGLWYDSRVTLVDGDEFEYIDWKPPSGELQSIPSEIRDNKAGKEDDGDSFFFPEEQLSQMGKGTRRLWRPWQRNIKRYDVRPYRCFHVGDLVEVPVMYPDFRYRYHAVDHSQLYLPARIIEVEGDQYMVEFSPDCLAYNWWPGRIAKGEGIELEPGSGVKVRNPFDVNRLTLSMDLVRPFSVGSRPVLGIQSLKPADWNAFQGVQLQNLEDLLEQSLWGDECDST